MHNCEHILYLQTGNPDAQNNLPTPGRFLEYQLLPKSLFILKTEIDYKARYVTNSIGLMLTCYVRSRNANTIFKLLNSENEALLFKPETIDSNLLLEVIKHHDKQGYAGYVFDLSKLMGHIDLLHMLRKD